MIDIINEYNTTEFMNFKSIIVGGGTTAPVPAYHSHYTVT